MGKTIKSLLLGLGLGILIMGLVMGRFRKTEIIDEESVVIRVVEKATPGVVTISAVESRDISGKDVGTGFIISEDGLIITNKHVVANSTLKYKVIVGRDLILDVSNIYLDPINDIAILKIDKTGLIPLIMGDSDKLKVGQSVIAIGTALGEFRSTVTKGVISGLGRGIVAGEGTETEKLENVIQTDAAINQGNSGGPLLNSNGEVIGVNVALSQSGKGISFALPINSIKESINDFQTTGNFDRPYLGVGYQLITKQAGLLNNVPAGALVREVTLSSPADKAGIKKGDILIKIDNLDLSEEKNTTLASYINHQKIGDKVMLKLWRDRVEMVTEIVLEKRP